MTTQKIVPFLWFESRAEEAVTFYTTLFKDSKITSTTRYGKEGRGPEGDVMVMGFELFGMEFVALNGNLNATFNDSFSMYVKCYTQEEIDGYWDALLDGGTPLACGWLRDKFGISWQITPPILTEMLGSQDRDKAGRVMKAMMKMVKIDIKKLKDAYDGNTI